MNHQMYVRSPVIKLGTESWSVETGLNTEVPQDHLPHAANENLKLKSDWMTPAEALQIVRRVKQRLRDENARTQAFFNSAARRRVWDELCGCEACLLWHYFR